MNPENKGPENNETEKEQTPEEILAIIAEAIEKGEWVLLTQLKQDGTPITNPAEPISIDGNYLTIEAGGYGIDIEISKITKAEIIKEEAVERKEPTPRPPLLDVVKIDGRWAQVIIGGNHIRYLDDQSEVSVDWNDYNYQPPKPATHVKQLLVTHEISAKELMAIHWGPEEKQNPEIKSNVHVFGEYKTKNK
jgi:hypothetical protein